MPPVNPNDHDVFILRQRWRPVINQYEFSLPNGGDKPGEAICFAEQKRFSFKEDIRFFTDDSKQHELMRIKARQRFDPMARYDVTDSTGARVGEIQKEFGQSLLRSTYTIYDAQGNLVAKATEKSMVVALFGRLVDIVPYIGDFADWLPIPYHFDFVKDDETIGTHVRQAWKFNDTYTIDMSGDPERTLDRRLVLAIAVGMDALQAR